MFSSILGFLFKQLPAKKVHAHGGGKGKKSPYAVKGGGGLTAEQKREAISDFRNADNPLYKPGKRSLKQLSYTRALHLKSNSKVSSKLKKGI